MNIQKLTEKLAEEGCNPSYYALGVRGAASDAYCLVRVDGVWQVFYTERGVDQAPMFVSADEAAACAWFYDLMMGMRHDHLVGFFRSEKSATALQATLQQHNIPFFQDSIPYTSPDDRRYRVFVTGKAIFPARELLGQIPVRDDSDS